MNQTTSTPVVPIRFDDKVVVISGASRGIGRVLARGFAAAGADTLFVARREDELRRLEKELLDAGHSGFAHVADLSEPEGVESMIDAALSRFGGIDVLVNNLGVAGPTARIEDTDLSDWESTIAVNLTSAFLAIRGAVPSMKARGGGAIVNIGSILGKTPYRYRSSYAATKMGLIGVTRVLAQELGPDRIRVNAILPGSVSGERGEEIFAAQAKARGITVQEARQQLLDMSPLGTQVSPESILNMALFLASEHAEHMTGQDINVTAGVVMY